MKNDQILYKKIFLEILIRKTKAMIRFTHVMQITNNNSTFLSIKIF